VLVCAKKQTKYPADAKSCKGANRAASAEGAKLHAQRARTRRPKGARHVPREHCSSTEGEHATNQVESINIHTTAAMNSTEAQPWNKADNKGSNPAINACDERGIPHINSGCPQAHDPMLGGDGSSTTTVKPEY